MKSFILHTKQTELEAALEAARSRDQSESPWQTFKAFNSNKLAVRNPLSHEQFLQPYKQQTPLQQSTRGPKSN